MSCEEVQVALHGYVDGELSQFERARVDAHLRRCLVCTEELRLLHRTTALLADLDNIEVPVNFRSDLMAKIVALPVRSSAAPQSAAPAALAPSGWRRWGLSSAAAAVIAALAFMNVYPQLARNISTPSVTGTNLPRPAGEIEPAAAPGPANPAPGSLTADALLAPGSIGITEHGVDSGPSLTEIESVAETASGTEVAAPTAAREDPEPVQPPAVTSPEGTPPKAASNPATPAREEFIPPTVAQDPRLSGATFLGAPAPGADPEVQGARHYTYEMLVQTADVDAAQGNLEQVLAIAARGKIVNVDHPSDRQAVLVIEVNRDDEKWLWEQIKAHGTVVYQASPQVNALQHQLDLRRTELAAVEEQDAELWAKLEAGGQPEMIRSAAIVQLENNRLRAQSLKMTLRDLEQKAQTSTFIVTLAAAD